MAELAIELVHEQADAQELDEATRSLQDDLDALDDWTVGQPSQPAPHGAKGLDAAMTGQLLLATVGSGGIAVTLVSVLRDWLMRHKDYKLRLKRGDTEIELCGSDPEALKRLLADATAWLRQEENLGA